MPPSPLERNGTQYLSLHVKHIRLAAMIGCLSVTELPPARMMRHQLRFLDLRSHCNVSGLWVSQLLFNVCKGGILWGIPGP